MKLRIDENTQEHVHPFHDEPLATPLRTTTEYTNSGTGRAIPVD